MLNGLLSLLIPLTMFSSAAASTQEIQTNICGLPQTPSISSPADGTTTTTSSTTVTGTASINTAINILDNGQLEASLTSDSSGNFSSSLSLTSGSNALVAQAENNCNQVASSSSVTVTYTPPAPPNNTTSNNTATTPVTAPAAPPVTSVVSLNTTTPTTVTSSSQPVVQSSGLSLSLSVPSGTKPLQTSSSGSYSISNSILSTSLPSVVLNGSTGVAANVEVIVNGKVVADIKSNSEGFFSVRIPVSVGHNKVVLVARTGDTQIVKTIQITRDAYLKKQPPGLYKLLSILIILVLIIGLFLPLIRRRMKYNKDSKK